MRRELSLDWVTILLYTFFVLFGWLNIYAASTNDASLDLFNIDFNYGKQFLFILGCVLIGFVIINFIDTRDIEFTAYIIYGICIAALIAVAITTRTVKGANSWFELGPFRLQPSEFAKIGTALALAKYMSRPNFSLKNRTDLLAALGIIALPALLVVMQGDAGTAIIFGGLILMLYREGLSPNVLVILTLTLVFGIMTFLVEKYTIINIIVLVGFAAFILQSKHKNRMRDFGILLTADIIVLFLLSTVTGETEILGLALTRPLLTVVCTVLLVTALVYYMIRHRRRQWLFYPVMVIGFSVLVFSINLIFENVLQPHQQDRIIALFDPAFDPQGINWNSTQSKIAIGSGGVIGKGYLQGTQTKFDYVPEQHTDFIFCTIGEEWGWLGSTVLIVGFLIFLAQLLYISEESKSNFGRIYGYAVTSMLFMHVAINIAMTIGLAPVIGIPLPFFSYGGSALVSFSLMVFILLRFHANRQNVLGSLG